MDNLKAIQNLDNIVNGLLNLIGPIASLAGFLFLTVWGWLIIIVFIVLIIIRKSRDKNGHFSIGNLAGSLPDLLFSLYSNIASVIMGLIILFFLTFVYSTLKDLASGLSLYRDVKMLEAALKNLKAERKILEIKAAPVTIGDSRAIQAKITYYAYSPVKDNDIKAGESECMIPGKKLFVDFGLLNFDYSLIEKGEAKNIAFPDRLFSETLSREKGTNLLFGNNTVPDTFNLEEKDIFILDKRDYQTEILKLVSAVTNEFSARKLGIRTAYGEAIGIIPFSERIYTFYSTEAGGIIIR
jgi:hypothetical protein